MTKLQISLVSLVAAIPGGVLAYVMVMAFLNHGGGSSGMLKGLAGGTLVVGSLLALMPIGIFIFAGPKKAKTADKDDDATELQEDDAADSGDVDAAQTVIYDSPDADDEDELADSADLDEAEATIDADADDFEMADDDEDLELGDDDSAADDDLEVTMDASGDDDDFSFDDEDDDAPAKGKKN